MKLDLAMSVAEQVLLRLQPHCERIAVAGSISRGRSEIGDLEIVALPKMVHEQTGLFTELDFPDEPTPVVSDLENFDWTQLGRALKGGERYKQIELELEGIEKFNLDLFIVLPPAQWGVIKTIRTGPADFSHWLLTPRRYGGAMPSHLKQRDGSLWNGATQVLTPDEEDYFQALGLAWVSPSDRSAPQGFNTKSVKR